MSIIPPWTLHFLDRTMGDLRRGADVPEMRQIGENSWPILGNLGL